MQEQRKNHCLEHVSSYSKQLIAVSWLLYYLTTFLLTCVKLKLIYRRETMHYGNYNYAGKAEVYLEVERCVLYLICSIIVR